ncbi:UNVERIFIED_CONTAM: hypothetical protein FKN15_024664 [Acipenser sinensis]
MPAVPMSTSREKMPAVPISTSRGRMPAGFPFRGRAAPVPCKKGRAAPVPCKRGRAAPVPCKRGRLHAAPTSIDRRLHAAPTFIARRPHAALPPSPAEAEQQELPLPPPPPPPGAEQQELPLPPSPSGGEEQELPLPSPEGPGLDAGEARGRTARPQRPRRGPTPAPQLVLTPCLASPKDACHASPKDACLASPGAACRSASPGVACRSASPGAACCSTSQQEVLWPEPHQGELPAIEIVGEVRRTAPTAAVSLPEIVGEVRRPAPTTASSLREVLWPEPHRRELPAMKKGEVGGPPAPAAFSLQEWTSMLSAVPLPAGGLTAVPAMGPLKPPVPARVGHGDRGGGQETCSHCSSFAAGDRVAGAPWTSMLSAVPLPARELIALPAMGPLKPPFPARDFVLDCWVFKGGGGR